jgi:hypothetical protein
MIFYYLHHLHIYGSCSLYTLSYVFSHLIHSVINVGNHILHKKLLNLCDNDSLKSSFNDQI